MAGGLAWNLNRRLRHFRDAVKKRPVIGFAILIVPLGVVAGVVWAMTGEDHNAKYRVDHLWFYDMNTKKLFQVNAGTSPPIDAPSGKPFEEKPAGVRAYVYGCGGCGDTFIGYLETNHEKAKEIFDQSEKHDSKTLGAARKMGTYIRAVDGEAWVRPDTQEAGNIKIGIVNRCGNQRAVPCYPRG